MKWVLLGCRVYVTAVYYDRFAYYKTEVLVHSCLHLYNTWQVGKKDKLSHERRLLECSECLQLGNPYRTEAMLSYIDKIVTINSIAD